jgi:hypothetical protein
MSDSKPTPQQIEALASVAGAPVTAEVAARIANSIGLPFDLEPATYTRTSEKCIGQ